MTTNEYLDQHRGRFESELVEFLSIPSVSTDPASAGDVARCAEWLANHLRGVGMPHVEVIPTPGHPIVYAERCEAGQGAPTVLFYGHYDVQPVDPIDLWTDPPFTPVIRNGKVYARGATDDKGQVFLHIKAIEALLAAEGQLPVNVKLLIEGEEEIGSPNLAPFVRQNATKLSCDAVLVSDTSMFAPGQPSIVYSLRGLAYMQINVQGPNRDLHSGSYGGAVQNPLNALATIISKLKDEYGRIQVEGFYDDVKPLTEQERGELAALGHSDERLKSDVNVSTLFGEDGYSSIERLGARPTLDVNGILGGFTGEGAKTVLPARAMAKVSMRLVPHQRHDDIANKFTSYVRSITPPGVTVDVQDLHGADPVLVNRDSPAMHAAVQALEETFGTTCRFTREGGSIPVVLLFDQVLNVPTVLMGFGLNNENAHSPDEHFDLQSFHTGMRAVSRYYHLLAQAGV
ncbi:MAG: hypothetical protein RIR53_1230 [Bacteroidota bacterium]|jgi:acetylornithine deacetylase/succinyl-diaminopimelate desuccinylase-like protein